jgi:hypothetical protein
MNRQFHFKVYAKKIKISVWKKCFYTQVVAALFTIKYGNNPMT